MPANRGQKPPRKRAAMRKGEALRAKSAGSMQPIGKHRAKAKAKPEIEPAVRITGVKQSREPRTFFEASRSNAPMELSSSETRRMQKIQRAAEDDPQAYMEACRAKAR
jgi:hypothetical protein